MKAITNYRFWVLLTLLLAAVVLLFCEADYLSLLIATKAGGVALFYVFHRLCEKWFSEGKMPELDELFKGL